MRGSSKWLVPAMGGRLDLTLPGEVAAMYAVGVGGRMFLICSWVGQGSGCQGDQGGCNDMVDSADDRGDVGVGGRWAGAGGAAHADGTTIAGGTSGTNINCPKSGAGGGGRKGV